MPRKWEDDAVAGSFEELPALIVVLVAVSLFSVSLAHATVSRDAASDYLGLQEDSRTFATMVASSPMLCVDGRPGVLDIDRLQNMSLTAMMEAFDPSALGFEYRIAIQCLDLESGGIALDLEFNTSEPIRGTEFASYNTCANVARPHGTGAARLTVTVWRAQP